MNTGSCLCKKITFSIKEPREVVNCHCEGCLKFHGNYAAFTKVNLKNIEINNSALLSWYRVVGDHAERGFCSQCGSSLFWQADNDEAICISAGALEIPTHLSTTKNIYTSHASDFYPLDKTLESYPTTMNPVHNVHNKKLTQK